MNESTSPNTQEENLASNSQEPEKNTTNNSEPHGIGGWLIVIAIDIVLTPIILMLSIFTTYLPQISSGVLENLSTPGNPAYHALWKPVIIFDLASNVLLLIVALILVFLFFTKKKLFPKLFFIFLIFRILLNVVDVYFLNIIKQSVQIDIPTDTIKMVAQPILFTIIWGTYMFTSVRVKNTFTR